MTVKELKELLENIKDEKEVIAEFNGKYFSLDVIRNNNSTNELIINLVKE